MDPVVNPIQRLLRGGEAGHPAGIYSCCSANEYVLRAAMRRAKRTGTIVLIESTANQVDQFGGYTGMKPEDFIGFVRGIAAQEAFPQERLLLGGDHLGPLTWRKLPAQQAMENAKALVRAYVLAGYEKIHLDTSMRLGDDRRDIRLPDSVIAQRGATLCQVAEEAFRERLARCKDAVPPVYVIGSEVPVPGGAEENESAVAVTAPEDCLATVRTFRETFDAFGLAEAWPRVVALVVQPGVEFADRTVLPYDPSAAAELTATLRELGGLVFEGHSTDYQTKEALRSMVHDGIAILKVGPALTFALREALFSLELIEKELAPMYDWNVSALRGVMERTMLAEPSRWDGYYHGTEAYRAFARAFSYSDRIRYYLPHPDIQAAIERLLHNLSTVEIPHALLMQYLPVQYEAVRSGALENEARALLIDHIGDRIDDYLYAIMR